MFLKLRIRRSNKEKDKDSKNGIFRSKARGSKEDSALVPGAVDQVLTMTLSEDDSDTCSEPYDATQDQPNLITFTEQQVMENTLERIREVVAIKAANEQQVKEMKSLQLKQIKEKEQLMEELRNTYERKIEEKQHELSKMNDVLEELKHAYEQKLESKQVELECMRTESEAKLAEKENELSGVKSELNETKQELVKVSSVLIGCQHELHDEKESKTFFWF